MPSASSRPTAPQAEQCREADGAEHARDAEPAELVDTGTMARGWPGWYDASVDGTWDVQLAFGRFVGKVVQLGAQR